MALRQLNFWKSGVSSLDSALLENISPAEFRIRVAEIAQTQGLSVDSEDVEHVVTTLLPLVEQLEGKDSQGEADLEPKHGMDVDASVDENGHKKMEVVIPSKADVDQDARENNVKESGEKVFRSSAHPNSDLAVEQSDMLDSKTEILQNDEMADSGLEKSILSPKIVSKHTSSEDAPKGITISEGAEDTVREGTTETHANNGNELQPDVIDWDELNESDDELRNPKTETPLEEVLKLDELDSITGLQQVIDPLDDSKTIAAVEGEEKGADTLSVNTSADRVEGALEARTEGDDGVLVEGQGIDSVDAGNAGPADDTRLNEDSSDDVDTNMKVVEDLSVEGVADNDVSVSRREAESGSVESGEQVHVKMDNDLKGLETFENPSTDTAGASNKGLFLVEEPSAIRTQHLGDNEALKEEKNKKEESPGTGIEVDGFHHGEGLVKAVTREAVVASDEEESNQIPPILETASDPPKKNEGSEKDVHSPADTKASTSSVNESASSLGGAGPSLPARPAGLGRSVPSLEHAPRAVQRSGGASVSARQASESNEENPSGSDASDGSEDAREKLQMIRVKFLRLAHRLGQSAQNVVVAQVLYRLGLAEQLRGGRGSGRSGAFSFERASVLAEEQEAAGTDDLEFGCTIMVLGKSGVGKSATINSLFDEMKTGTNAYSPATNKVQEIVGTVHGIKLRVIDTPGLLTSFADQRRNERIMSSVKRFIKKSPPDIVLYFDRLDMQSRDYGDLPLLRTITDTFGSAVWFNAIVVLTHASSAPPDGANGVPVSYEMFVAQRSHVVQQTIRQAAGDMRLMNPVSLVENHAACRRNRLGERVLPNGQVWKPQLLLLCFASKILAEANSLLKLQDNTPAKPFGVRSRVPPLPFLLSSLLQSRPQLKLPDEQVGTDDEESEDESDEEADSEGEEEYDDLPPFRRLTREELKLLDKEQRRTYAEELEYRERLFMKKQLKDERARKKEMKRRLAALPKEAVQYAEENLEEENAAASVPVPMPDMALPPSFDSDNPSYRYRYLDAANQWLVRPVLEPHGWDHDSGYDGLNVEKMFVVSKKVPVSISGQVTKDKKEANLQMECAGSVKIGEGTVTQAGLDIQTIGKDVAYTLRNETRFDNFKRNKTTCGLTVTLLGDAVAAGMKVEDRLLIGKRVKLVFNGGALTGRGDVAYGGSLEATIRDKDYPIGQFLSTFGLSVMNWHGDLAIGGNLQAQFKVGKTMTVVRGNLNNRKAGQVSVRVSSSEHLQFALICLIPVLQKFIKNRILTSN